MSVMTAPRRRRVALTGGIASGKSAAARLFAERGAVVIDTDVIAREVVEPGSPGLARVVDRFGEQVLQDDGGLDRAALGRVVFADAGARRDLEAILHPLIRARAAELEAAVPVDRVAIVVIPLLVETGQAGDLDEVLVVDVPEQTQLDRLRGRDGLDADEARARLAAQATRAERLAVASHVLDNDHDLPALARQVDATWRALVRPRDEAPSNKDVDAGECSPAPARMEDS